MNKGISLHIGINKLSTKWYRKEAALCSPANDAMAMLELAKQEGYETNLLLVNEKATKAAFIENLESCAGKLNNGDTLLLTYSGHGGQQKDTDLDEVDGKDETWCFFDSHLTDDELGGMWKEFGPGVRIIVVSSSCHSRSSLKPHSTGLPFWQMPGGRRQGQKPIIYSYPYDSQIRASILHISACEDNQQARDGEQFSRFTELLLKNWDGGRFNGTYEELVRLINQESGYLQSGGIALLGKYDSELINSIPFKLLTNKT